MLFYVYIQYNHYLTNILDINYLAKEDFYFATIYLIIKFLVALLFLIIEHI